MFAISAVKDLKGTRVYNIILLDFMEVRIDLSPVTTLSVILSTSLRNTFILTLSYKYFSTYFVLICASKSLKFGSKIKKIISKNIQKYFLIGILHRQGR